MMVRVNVVSDLIKSISLNIFIENESNILIGNINNFIIDLLNEFEIPYLHYDDNIKYVYPNSIDILHKLLNNKSNYESTNYELNKIFVQLLNPPQSNKPLKCVFKKDDPDAIIPFKTRCSDSGYDLTIIKEVKKSGNAILYDTGIKIIPPQGYNLVIRPRSSFYKTGYMIANTIGTIDTSYRGTFFVPLIKVDKTKPDIKLPFTGFQIVLERFNHFELIEAIDEFDIDTHRDVGGFGSTDSKEKKETTDCVLI